MNRYFFFLFVFAMISCKEDTADEVSITIPFLIASESEDEIKIHIEGREEPIVIQNAQANHRPYLHPITTPTSKSSLTEYSPGHHKHQTGLYWGFTRVNGSGAPIDTLTKWFYRKDKPKEIQDQIGRDYFHNPGEGYWKKVAANILTDKGEKVRWETKYHLLDETGEPILLETQTWTASTNGNENFFELEWKGEALKDFTVNEFSYGGLFLRMPWREGIEGEAVNAARQKNIKAESQRAMWVDVGMQIEGLDEWGHIAIFDHPDNEGFPTPWRVDGQLGVGPSKSIQGDWSIEKGDAKIFRHQIVAYEGQLNDVKMNELWGDYVGDKGMYNTASLWGIAQREALDAKFLGPDEAVAEMTTKDGYETTCFASEPMITQPMAFCWDDKGRMWIAENRDYESRGHGFSNSGDSKILILEDTDKDGIIDSKKVFLEGIPFPSAIAVGFDGLYLGAPPNLLFVPDKDKDDVADVEDIEVLLTGWGIRDRHETINSFHWGPDGWLYGLEGFATPSVIRKPVGKGKIYKAGEAFPDDLLDAEGVDINGGVWRFHPIKKRFEAIAHGFSNPWGIDYDSKGQLFISACVIPHLFHIIPGGIYHRQGGKHFNPYVYKDIQTIVDHRHRSAHGGARIYQSDAFAEEEQGKIFMCNIHEHNIISDVLHQNGSGFTASHGDEFMEANNAQWIGFSLEIGPDGGLYALDWHDADICGKEVLNKETGRVYKIMPKNSSAENWEGRYEDLNTFSDLALMKLQESKSNWHAQRARVILQHRAISNSISDEAKEYISELLKDSKRDEDLRLRALWTMHICNLIRNEELIKLLDDKHEYVRAWTIQFLNEDENASDIVISKMADMASADNSAAVRLYLSAALQKISHDNRWEILEKLVQHQEDADDPNIPLMVWFGLEPIVSENPELAIDLGRQSKIPLVANHIARRLIDDDKIEPLISNLASNHKNSLGLLNGVLAGVESRNDLQEPEAWSELTSKFRSGTKEQKLIENISQFFGSAANAKLLIDKIIAENTNLDEKKSAINTLALQQRTELKSELPKLLKVEGLRADAIRAVAQYEDKSLGESILQMYDSLSAVEKKDAIQTLSSRPVYGWLLAGALKEDLIPRKDIAPYIALQLRRVVGNGFVEIWGPIDDISSNKQADYAKYRRLLQDNAIAQADVHQGAEVYFNTCYACHQMYGDGGNIGPDLTGSNRANVNYILGNVIEPSTELQDDYKLVVITTQDGRTYSGNILEENDRQITLRAVGQENLKINKSDIQSREQTEKSMMPEGLFANLSNDEVLALMAYLRTTAPLDKANPSDD